MRFTDIFIRRPVLAVVVSLLILLVGARSLDTLDERPLDLKSPVALSSRG